MKQESQKSLYTVLDPQGQPSHGIKTSSIYELSAQKKEEKYGGQPAHGIKPLSMAPRLDTLNGKTVYLVDVGFGGDAGGYSLLTEMQKWFAKHNPQVNTVLKRKPGSFGADAPDLWEEIKEKGNAMIMAIGH